MARYVTTVKTARTPQNVFAYMADLRNFTEWDPGVKAVKRAAARGPYSTSPSPGQAAT